jgi:hypothetical protein
MFLEVKRRPGLSPWHPHLHVMVEGTFLSQKALASAWHAITGDSYIVHITRVRDDDRMVDYVCKYASKPMDASVLQDAEALKELAVAIKGRRLVQCFGSWRKLDLDADAPDPAGWHTIGTLASLLRDAKSGDAVAREIAKALVWDRLDSVTPAAKPP